MVKRGTYRISLGGMLTAVGVTIMMLGSVIPFAVFVSPLTAAVCVLYFCVEYDRKTALIIYTAMSLLSILVAPDKELACVFIFITGYYPVVKTLCEKLKSKLIELIIKLAVFNAAVFAMYYVITKIFIIASVKDEFQEFTAALAAAAVLLANLSFLMYDILLTRLVILYVKKIRPKLSNQRHR